MSKLYAELRHIAEKDSTVYMYLKAQQATQQPDFETAVALIHQLVKEKGVYLDDAINTRNLSIIPIKPFKPDSEVL